MLVAPQKIRELQKCSSLFCFSSRDLRRARKGADKLRVKPGGCKNVAGWNVEDYLSEMFFANGLEWGVGGSTAGGRRSQDTGSWIVEFFSGVGWVAIRRLPLRGEMP